MDRRAFVGAAGLGAVAVGAAHAQGGLGERRDIYELRRYQVAADGRQGQFDEYLQLALLPALARLGVAAVGVFRPVSAEQGSWVQLLLVHDTPATVAAAGALPMDEAFMTAAAPFFALPPAAPLYDRVESSLLLAFDGHPTFARPTSVASRVFELRRYESHNEASGAKKIEMFNRAEIAIFRRTGLPPVFFGQALVGAALPNLTYMLGFDDEEARRAGWKTFVADPEWKELAGRTEYADSAIVSRITSDLLVPTSLSAI